MSDRIGLGEEGEEVGVEEVVAEVLNSQTGSPVSGVHQRNALNF